MSNSFCKNRGYVVFYCYISSNSVLFLMFWTFVAFNTSHVKVNLAPAPHLLPQLNRFNTSHVKVNRDSTKRLFRRNHCFDTSHVKVNLQPVFHTFL